MGIITGVSFFSLKQANRINKHLIDCDMVFLETADKLIDKLLAQELYGRRYTILKSNEMKTLFWKESIAVTQLIDVIQKLPDPFNASAKRIRALYGQFISGYNTWFKHMEKIDADNRGNSVKIQATLDELLDFVHGMIHETKENQRRLVIKTKEMTLQTIQRIVMLSLSGILIGGIVASLMIAHISRSVTLLKTATKKIANGEFDYPLNIHERGEFGELACEFKKMAKRLAQLEEIYRDASPLTRLPGGIAIENLLKHRLEARKPIAFILLDLDNFKSYNDKYGYAQGNEIIKFSANIIKQAVTDHGSPNDFVGHIGGDDFSVITTPDHYAAICQTIIEHFDAHIDEFYDIDDKENGYITSVNRQGKTMTFPIMTISISVVLTSDTDDMTGVEIGEIAAELKTYAKSFPKSIFVVNRREMVLSEQS